MNNQKVDVDIKYSLSNKNNGASIIILGSSRSDGNTQNIVTHIAEKINAEVIDLNEFHILPYDYGHNNQHDDFVNLIEYLLTFDKLIFASPVYWYSPSGIMKIFLDRLCDLIEINKHRGRMLKNKSAAIISTGAAAIKDNCFEEIFRKTFEYFEMKFNGSLYCQRDINIDSNSNIKLIDDFISLQLTNLNLR